MRDEGLESMAVERPREGASVAGVWRVARALSWGAGGWEGASASCVLNAQLRVGRTTWRVSTLASQYLSSKSGSVISFHLTPQRDSKHARERLERTALWSRTSRILPAGRYRGPHDEARGCVSFYVKLGSAAGTRIARELDRISRVVSERPGRDRQRGALPPGSRHSRNLWSLLEEVGARPRAWQVQSATFSLPSSVEVEEQIFGLSAYVGVTVNERRGGPSLYSALIVWSEASGDAAALLPRQSWFRAVSRNLREAGYEVEWRKARLASLVCFDRRRRSASVRDILRDARQLEAMVRSVQ